MSPVAQTRYGEALWAVGRDSEAIAASRRALDLGEPWAGLNLFVSHMISGELDAAIAAYETYLKMLGKDASGVEAWVRAASNPITGRQSLLESLEDQEFINTAHREILLLAFGYLDDFYDELEKNVNSDGFWSDNDLIIQVAHFHRRPGVTAHPRYVPIMEAMGGITFWEERGPPDHCTKEAGVWRCE